ncbi:hypothetical protein HZU73_02624 [Apis mellifera caucasica]|uniref:Uncharacterized protein LOC102656479 n=1 Tax=Apis mellifera TaxID=7460 RepID=A0A7M7H0S1_APIME|nr:uncharacterized protein LOC102656479 [Apis mellifera]KAG6801838.1 hypothetical protein HZU73_02624 [Apis mellifera caucasica]KAG9433485.1 hypothetical protein HZU67_05454 [Apis mellifera carnica]|eukprot:XP_006571878.1 uncharacterized protein LOC102656479 [Apis mellifera]
MKSLYIFIFITLLLVNYIHTLSVIIYGENRASVINNNKIEKEQIVRVKRSPLIKLPLLVGATVIGKKALLLGGTVFGAKTLIGAGLVGASLYKAKYYGGGYGDKYASYQYAPSYVESNWS